MRDFNPELILTHDGERLEWIVFVEYQTKYGVSVITKMSYETRYAEATADKIVIDKLISFFEGYDDFVADDSLITAKKYKFFRRRDIEIDKIRTHIKYPTERLWEGN